MICYIWKTFSMEPIHNRLLVLKERNYHQHIPHWNKINLWCVNALKFVLEYTFWCRSSRWGRTCRLRTLNQKLMNLLERQILIKSFNMLFLSIMNWNALTAAISDFKISAILSRCFIIPTSNSGQAKIRIWIGWRIIPEIECESSVCQGLSCVFIDFSMPPYFSRAWMT